MSSLLIFLHVLYVLLGHFRWQSLLLLWNPSLVGCPISKWRYHRSVATLLRSRTRRLPWYMKVPEHSFSISTSIDEYQLIVAKVMRRLLKHAWIFCPILSGEGNSPWQKRKLVLKVLEGLGHQSFASHWTMRFYGMHLLTHWIYQISYASVGHLQNFIIDFLERYSLLWVNAVALFGDLRISISSAQWLKAYAKQRSHQNSQWPPTSFRGNRDEELQQWANDLIRLAARLGSYLAESPSAIHRYIIPFCLADSMLSQSFGYLSKPSISAMGISSGRRDNCLERLTMGEDENASKVICKDNHFIALLSSTGTLVVWHANRKQVRSLTLSLQHISNRLGYGLSSLGNKSILYRRPIKNISKSSIRVKRHQIIDCLWWFYSRNVCISKVCGEKVVLPCRKPVRARA